MAEQMFLDKFVFVCTNCKTVNSIKTEVDDNGNITFTCLGCDHSETLYKLQPIEPVYNPRDDVDFQSEEFEVEITSWRCCGGLKLGLKERCSICGDKYED